MAPQRFFHIFPMELKNVLTNYEQQLLLYIFYEKGDFYLLVTSKAFLVQVQGEQEHTIIMACQFI